MTDSENQLSPGDMPRPLSFLAFSAGLILGYCIDFVQALVIGLDMYDDEGNRPPGFHTVYLFIVPVMIMMCGAWLALRGSKLKAFGFGLLISTPLMVIVAFCICGVR